jgi:putative ABC transport system substrate-binding protein
VNVRRREFIKLVAGTAALPVAGYAQPAKLPMIGFLGGSTAALASQRVAAFEQRLKELDWVAGRTIAIEYRWADGRFQRSPEIIAEFIKLKVDVIVTHATANIIAAKRATAEIPIVFAVAADPIGTGLVASLARPGGNITGLSIQATDLAGKRLGLLREIVPALGRLAILVNARNPASALERHEVEAAARSLGLVAITSEIQRAEDIEPAFQAIKNGRADAIYVCADPLVNANRTRISTLALSTHMPMILDNREFVAAGGLTSYGPNIPDLFRRAADYVDKILKGEKPANLPVEQPTKFDFIINLTTAKALGLAVPPTLLARADEVIE